MFQGAGFGASRDPCSARLLEKNKMLSSILNFRVGGDKAEGMAGRREC